MAIEANWKRLFRIARSLLGQANVADDDWTFGGGTAMMLQIDHRDSRDVDVFLSDPQLLAMLDPGKNDFEFEIRPDEYVGDGSRTLKLAFSRIGEIDFIAAGTLTASPTVPAAVDGRPVLLETVPEIITKKVYHRGAVITPRDIFDIAAGAVRDRPAIIAGLRRYHSAVSDTLAAVERLNPSFVNAAISQLVIRDGYKETAETALDTTTDILRAAAGSGRR